MNNAQDATAAKNQKSKISSNSRTDKKRSGSKRQMNSLWNGQHWKNTHCHQSQGMERHNQRGQLIFVIHNWWSGSRRGAEKMFDLQARTLAGRVGRRGVNIRESCTLCSLQYIFQHRGFYQRSLRRPPMDSGITFGRLGLCRLEPT